MSLAMKLPKILCAASLGIAGVLGLIFLLDLILGIPFSRNSVVADIAVVVACALIIWQGLETWREV